MSYESKTEGYTKDSETIEITATSGTINLSSTKPTRSNYTFLGWSLSSTATSASYSPGQAWSRSNASNYTLYAVWRSNVATQLTVSGTPFYNGNGMVGNPSGSGFTFYYSSINSEYFSYDNNGTFTVKKSGTYSVSMSISNQFGSEPGYSVSFYKNGSSQGSASTNNAPGSTKFNVSLASGDTWYTYIRTGNSNAALWINMTVTYIG